MAKCIENFEDNAMSIQYVRITKPANEKLSNIKTKEVIQNDEEIDANNVDSVHRKQNRDRAASVSRNSDSEDDNIDYYAPERKKNSRHRSRNRRSNSARSRSSSRGTNPFFLIILVSVN